MKQTPQKGVNKKRNEETELRALVSQKEVESFMNCGNHTGKDNILFFENGSNKNKMFLLLHGSADGFVKYNNTMMNLQQVFQALKTEVTFDILTTLDIKCINGLCCHGFYQDPYEENGIIIKPFFTNKGCLLGKQISPHEYQFITEERLVA